jgi:hypothetical protein
MRKLLKAVGNPLNAVETTSYELGTANRKSVDQK